MSMTPDAYRKAYDKALTDLTSISETFEQLRTRKSLIENVIAALEPVFASSQQAEPVTASIAARENPQHSAESPAAEEAQGEQAASYSFLAVPSPLPESDGDPFQRRTRGNFHFKGLSAQRTA